MRESTTDRISDLGLVPVVAINDIDTAFQMMSSLIEGGLPCVEVTYRTPYATKTIKNLSNHFPDALIGAGTVLTMKQARNAIDAGAKFVVSPGFDEEIVDFCIESETLVIPGCATATEIMRAIKKGLNIVKFFPAEQLGGTAIINALAAPFSNIKFVPSGGINANNLSGYLNCKHVLACSGSWMVKKSILESGDYHKIKQLTEQAVCIVKGVRQ